MGRYRIAVLAGDGIGPEVVDQAVRVLQAVGKEFQHEFVFRHSLVGGAAFDEHGEHLPAETVEAARSSDAILFGSVGGPVNELHLEKWKNCEANSLLGLRREFKLNANYRPARVYPSLSELCPLRPSIVEDGVDLLILRELTGDIYFGEHTRHEKDGIRTAEDIARYDENEIAAVTRLAFQAAQKRRGVVTSVDKANVLETSRLWREVVTEIHGREFGEVQLHHMLVDNCAMQLIKNPSQFDVILTSNLFGDILSDAASVLPGSLGLCPSASLSSTGFGMYEPSGGSAQDIAGRGVANPAAQILSAALLLRFSFGLTEEASLIESAVETAIDEGVRTADIAEDRSRAVSTAEFGDTILRKLERTGRGVPDGDN